MKECVYPDHPDITPDMWIETDRIMEKWKQIPGSLITVLRECQTVVGYLPGTLLEYISKGLKPPISQVFGVATFYSFFSLKPKGRHTIRVCTGTACYVKGSKEAMLTIKKKYGLEEGDTTDDRRFSLECVRCLGACGLAPVMIVDKNIHGEMTSQKVLDVLEEYK